MSRVSRLYQIIADVHVDGTRTTINRSGRTLTLILALAKYQVPGKDLLSTAYRTVAGDHSI